MFRKELDVGLHIAVRRRKDVQPPGLLEGSVERGEARADDGPQVGLEQHVLAAQNSSATAR